MSQHIFAIYARARNGVIGKDGALPWRLSADLRHFKALTMGDNGAGHPMVMGRKTFDSFPAPLPGRRHIVLTRDRQWRADGAELAHSLAEALALAGAGTVAIIGGAEIYAQALPLADRVEMTEIHADYDGDTAMPPLPDEWAETAREEYPAEGDRPAYAFVTYERHA